jgi:hypothetical protein
VLEATPKRGDAALAKAAVADKVVDTVAVSVVADAVTTPDSTTTTEVASTATVVTVPDSTAAAAARAAPSTIRPTPVAASAMAPAARATVPITPQVEALQVVGFHQSRPVGLVGDYGTSAATADLIDLALDGHPQPAQWQIASRSSNAILSRPATIETGRGTHA